MLVCSTCGTNNRFPGLMLMCQDNILDHARYLSVHVVQTRHARNRLELTTAHWFLKYVTIVRLVGTYS